MTADIYLAYENFYDNAPVANGINPQFIAAQSNWKAIYASGLVNYLCQNPDAFLQSIPANFKKNFRVIPLQQTQPGNENWLVIDTSYHINAALSETGFFHFLSPAALQKIRSAEVKLVIWHAHECPYQQNPFPQNEKPFWFIHTLRARLQENNIPASAVYLVVGNLNLTAVSAVRLPPVGYDYFQNNYYNYCSKHPLVLQNSTARSKHFLCVNATPVAHRLVLTAELFLRHLHTRGHISFLNRRANDQFQFSGAHFKQLEVEYGTDYSTATAFLNALPLRLDMDAAAVAQDDRQLPASFIADSYFSIITESLASNTPPDNPLFITEKTYKPLYYMHPFMVAGCAGTLHYLRAQGYHTFPEWFDESYDNEPDKKKRLHMIISETEKICRLPLTQLQKMYQEILPKLQHNRQLFLSGRNQEKNFLQLIETIALANGRREQN